MTRTIKPLFLALLALIIPVSAQEAPPGYRKVFAADFSSTTITPKFSGQWWYLLSGVEKGRNWSSTKELDGGTGYGFAIQTLMESPKISPMDYQEAQIAAEGAPGTNKFLRFINRKRDGDAKSRVQLVSSFRQARQPIEGIYSRISFRIGSDMKSKLQGTWLDLIEVHDIGGAGGGGTSDLFRQSLYIIPDPANSRFYYRLQLRNETKNTVVYRVDLDDFKGWDRWEKVAFQFEAVATDRPALVRVWVNGKLLVEKNDAPAGYPIRNFHPAKAYIDNSTQATVPFVIDFDDWEFYLKEGAKKGT